MKGERGARQVGAYPSNGSTLPSHFDTLWWVVILTTSVANVSRYKLTQPYLTLCRTWLMYSPPLSRLKSAEGSKAACQ